MVCGRRPKGCLDDVRIGVESEIDCRELVSRACNAEKSVRSQSFATSQ